MLILSHAGLMAQQTEKRPPVFSVRSHYGFIIPHSETIRHLTHTYPFGAELDISLLNHREKDWKHCNCFSLSGLGISYIDFANPDVLGGALNLHIYVEPMLRYRGNVNISVRLGTGLSYITRVYDSILNPENLFFSSHYSYLLVAGLNLKYRISQKLFLTLSGNYNHISNGGVKLPNKGMNFPTASLGIDYLLHPVVLRNHPKYTDTSSAGKFRLVAGLFSSVKVHGQTTSFPSKTCWIVGATLKTSAGLNRFNRLGIGLQWIYDGYIAEKIYRDKLGLDANRLAVIFGHELLVGSFVFSTELGWYVYAPYSGKDNLYQKYDLLYYFSDRLYAGVFLKAHRHVAELMGVGLGWSFF
jgi:hypothetical protein